VCALQLTTERGHSDGFTHARPDEFVSIGVEDYLVERIGVAIKNRSHDAVRGLGDGATKN
ncbi:MAG TPA: hypothetical protein VMU69_23390, partial [Bradyrhizobium sp.]|nr:hypothetical protein [Bradyrhizobium sp.]